MTTDAHVIQPLRDEDNRYLQRTLLNNLAKAISTTATQFLCERLDRVPERAHLVELLTDILCDGSGDRAVLGRYVAREEELVADPDMYAEAYELMEMSGTLTLAPTEADHRMAQAHQRKRQGHVGDD